MIEIKGKYNSAKVFVDDYDKLEEACYKQILNLLNQKFSENSQIRIMEDCHAGSGCVIGFTQTIIDKVVPNLVGVDIGCGMQVLKISKDFHFDLKNLDKVWRANIPMGMTHRTTKHKFCENVNFDNLITPINKEKELLALGSLGGGNHFGELDIDEEGNYYLVIHSGSRHLGIEVCKYWQNKAIEYQKAIRCTKSFLTVLKQNKAISEKDYEELLDKHRKEMPNVPNELAYLEGEDLKGYLHDMEIAQNFAYWSRKAMQDEICKALNIKKKHIIDEFCTIHNYVDIKNKIIRKGSISLYKDEIAIIPMNMADGSLIVKGKGNEDRNCSGPHGAGRLMSRSVAKESLKMEDFKKSMKEVYTTSVCVGTIDESPMAYKPMQQILETIDDTCEVLKIIKPIWNVKANDGE